MGNSISAPFQRGTFDGTREDHELQLVLCILPTVKKLTKDLERQFNPQDKRYSYLGNVYTAATVLYGHLCTIKEAGSADQFKAQIHKLAELLEGMFENGVVDLTQGEVSLLPPIPPWLRCPQLISPQVSQNIAYPRLRTIQKTMQKLDGSKIINQELQSISVACSSIAWDQLERRLGELSDELQRFGDDMPVVSERPHSLITSPYAAEELRLFAERIYTTLSCTKCETKSQREMRLKIGTYKKVEQYQGTTCLYTLLAQESSPHEWHEVLIHDTQLSG